MLDPSSEASKCLRYLNKCITALVESGGSGSEETEKLNEAHEAFKIAFQNEKIESLKAVLHHLSVLTLEKVSLPNFYMLGQEKEEMRRELTHLVRINIIDCLEKSLENESDEELLKLAKFIEGYALLDEDEFQVSNASHVDSFVSCLEIAVSLRGTLSPKLLGLVNQRILPDFDKLPEQRKLDFLRAFAEICPLTTSHLADEMLPSVVGLLEKYIPVKKSTFDENKSFTHLEYLLYVFHNLAYKGQDASAKVEFCERLKERLKCAKNITKARIKEQIQTLHGPGRPVLGQAQKHTFFFEMRRQNIKTDIRTCINLVAMIKELLSKRPSYMGDNSVKLSWKKAKKPVSGEHVEMFMECASSRPGLLRSLMRAGVSYVDEECVISLIGLYKFQQAQQSNRVGSYLLSDNGAVAMICWLINETEFSRFRDKEVGRKGSTGAVRNQLFHLLCWAYASSDLARGKLEPHKLKTKWSPFCTWYMCAFCHPEALGTEPRMSKREMHHCYGARIENGLGHIQKYGIPREYSTIFKCTDGEPPSADEPRMYKRKVGFRRIKTLKEALAELEFQAVGADLIVYTGLFDQGDGIYYGPNTMEPGHFFEYHSVIMEYLKIINGELVVACKMSNGEEVADDGYVNVSLATVYIPVGASDAQKNNIRVYSEPVHLLTNFIVPELDNKEIDKNDEEEEDSEEDEEEEDMNKDKKENAKDNEEPGEEEPYVPYVPVAKRQRTPASNPRRFKSVTVEQEGSLLLEMQQRAIVINPIVDWHADIRSSLVEKTPGLDEATFNVRSAGSLPASVSTTAKHSVSIPNGVAAAPLVDLLLDLDSDDILAASSSSGADFLQDLIGVDLGSSSEQSGSTPAPKAGTDPLSTADINNNICTALHTLSSSAPPPHIATTASGGAHREGSLRLEMQQGAVVINPIVDRLTDIRSSLVDRMPVLDEATFNVSSDVSLPPSVSTIAKPSVGVPNGVAQLH